MKYEKYLNNTFLKKRLFINQNQGLFLIVQVITVDGF
jgi:hypothetical protein